MKKTIKDVFWLIIMAIVIITTIIIYNKYNYNDFIKSVQEKDKTIFTRDSETTYSEMDSYKIENTDYSDAMFYQTVSVTPNTSYKVTCKVKVENVENENNTKTGGAHICVVGTTERSIMICGTQEWQEITFLFNSKNREEVDIGFRLGGYDEKSKGTVWFSDFKIEVGTASTSNEWKMVCFIFPEIDVDVEANGVTEHVNLKMSDTDIQDLRADLQRFESSIASMSNNQMKASCDVYIIEEPIKTLSYDEENGYYVSPDDVYECINTYLEENEYDHIFVGIRMADIQSRQYHFN